MESLDFGMEEKEHIYLSTEHRKEIEGTVIFPSETSAFW